MVNLDVIRPSIKMKYKKKRFVEIPGTKNTTYENLMIYQISKKVSYKLVMKKKEEME